MACLQLSIILPLVILKATANRLYKRNTVKCYNPVFQENFKSANKNDGYLLNEIEWKNRL